MLTGHRCAGLSEIMPLSPRVLLGRATLFALVWLSLTGGDPGSWLLGGPAVVAATWLSARVSPPLAFRPLAFLAFCGSFAWRSLLGAVDVAGRALGPRVRLAPALIDYRTRLPEGLPRVFFVNCVSLTPGTLGADLDGDHLRIHVLDGSQAQAEALEAIEAAIAKVFPP
jgi:multicomponent Na+:H+ antiporter subunit E